MNGCELVSFVTAVACSMKRCLSSDELGLYAAVFTQLGDTLATLLTHEDLCTEKESGERAN